MDSALTNQTILITGASGGIGLATAQAFADEGARLVLHYHTNPGPLEALRAQLPTPSAPIQADLRDETQVDRLFTEALATFPRIDAVIANAAIYEPADVPLHDMTTHQWHNTLRANLDSVFFTCRAFLRHLRDVPREAPSLTLVASTAALFGEANHADYSTSKAAIAYGLTRSLKNEIVTLAPRGRVNCVCPGWTRTPMAEFGLSDPAIVKWVQSTMPLRKIAEPADVAAAIVFLTSDRLAGHLSGTILPIAGGMEGRLLHRA